MNNNKLVAASIVLFLFFLFIGTGFCAEDGKVTMDQWMKIINSGDAKKSLPPQTTGKNNKTIPGISQQQLIEAVKTFRLEAIVEPVATIKKYSSISALQDFTGIENALFTETPPEVGWKYFFATATYTVAPLTTQTHIVLFITPGATQPSSRFGNMRTSNSS